MLPVLDPGGAPAEIEGTVHGGGGVGSDGLHEALGTARLSVIGRVPVVFHLHVEVRRSLHPLGQIRSPESRAQVGCFPLPPYDRTV